MLRTMLAPAAWVGRRSEPHPVAGAFRRRVAVAAVMVAIAPLSACQPQGPLFPDMVAPTTAQADAMGWPAPRYINIGQGDNQDPTVGNPNYPYGGDWFMQPGYMQG